MLSSLLNGTMLTGCVTRNFQNSRFSGVQFERKVDKKSKPTRKLKHANSILEYLEYFWQISSKSMHIISNYTVSKLVRFFWDTVYISVYIASSFYFPHTKHCFMTKFWQDALDKCVKIQMGCEKLTPFPPQCHGYFLLTENGRSWRSMCWPLVIFDCESFRHITLP